MLYARTVGVRPQPLLAVADVQRASRWYQRVLGGVSGHGGNEYDQVLLDGAMVLQLHVLEVGHHHGRIADPALPLGNGVAVWFEIGDFDAVVYLVVFAEAS